MNFIILNEFNLSQPELNKFLSDIDFNSDDIYFLQESHIHIAIFIDEIYSHISGKAKEITESSLKYVFNEHEFILCLKNIFRDVFIGAFDLSYVRDLVNSINKIKHYEVPYSTITLIFSYYQLTAASYVYLKNKSNLDSYSNTINSLHKSLAIHTYIAAKVYGAK